jgi:hypothetical protein
MCFRLYFAASTQKPPELAKYNILYSANSRIFYENWQNIIKNSPSSKKLFAPPKKFVTFATLLPQALRGVVGSDEYIC